MRFVSFRQGGRDGVAVRRGADLVDLGANASLLDLIAAGRDTLLVAGRATETCRRVRIEGIAP